MLINKAVSDKTGKCRLYLDEVDLGGHRIYNSGDERKSVEVESIRLDDYFKIGKINFIKMDIEGAEPKAMKGMPSLLKRSKNVKIFTEFVPHLLRKSGVVPEKYLENLWRQGFKIYNVRELEHKLDTMTIEESRKMEKETRGTNLLCLKN